MTDAPKKIWACSGSVFDGVEAWEWGLAYEDLETWDDDQDFTPLSYTLTTHSDALVVAAYEDGLSDGNAIAHGNEPACDPPAKAQAAYDAAISQARREGWEAGRSEAAELMERASHNALSKAEKHKGAEKRDYTTSAVVHGYARDAIQALEYKEPG